MDMNMKQRILVVYEQSCLTDYLSGFQIKGPYFAYDRYLNHKPKIGVGTKMVRRN